MKRPDFQNPPIHLEPETHSYVWLPTMMVLLYSVTGVTSLGKKYTGDPAHGIRGTRIHAALQHWMMGWEQPDWHGLNNWIEPLFRHRYWDTFEPWLVEGTLCDLKKSCGGQVDLLGYCHDRKKVTVVDLKTQGKRNVYDVRPQMGAYSQMIADIHGVVVEECRVMWARPETKAGEGGPELGMQSPANECCELWDEKWDLFKTLKKKHAINANPTPPLAVPAPLPSLSAPG